MITESSETGSSGRTPAQFTTTHWSVVLAAVGGESPQADAAMDRLCRTYWYPLYVYVRNAARRCPRQHRPGSVPVACWDKLLNRHRQ